MNIYYIAIYQKYLSVISTYYLSGLPTQTIKEIPNIKLHINFSRTNQDKLPILQKTYQEWILSQRI